MRALTWQGRRDVRVETVPDPTIQQPTDAIIRVTSTAICGSDLHLYEVLGPVPLTRRHPRSRADGRRGGGGLRGQPHQAGRPGRHPLQHLLRLVLDVLPRAVRAVRDDPGPRAGQGRVAVRLHLALRLGPGRPGRVPAGAAGAVRPDQGPRGRPGRAVPLPLRRAADRLAGRAVRRRTRGRHARGARPRPDRADGHPDRAAPRRRAGHRRRLGGRPAADGGAARRRDAGHARRRRRRRGADRAHRWPRTGRGDRRRRAWRRTARPAVRRARWPRRRSACCRTPWRSRSPTSWRSTGWTRCTRRSSRSAAAGRCRCPVCTAARSTRCR